MGWYTDLILEGKSQLRKEVDSLLMTKSKNEQNTHKISCNKRCRDWHKRGQYAFLRACLSNS